VGRRFLMKEGASSKTWQKRFFRLRADFTLEYGKDQKARPSFLALPLSSLSLLLHFAVAEWRRVGSADEDDFDAGSQAGAARSGQEIHQRLHHSTRQPVVRPLVPAKLHSRRTLPFRIVADQRSQHVYIPVEERQRGARGG